MFGFANALTFGQAKFFTPWLMPTWLSPPGSPSATSYYDTAPLRETLIKHVNFGLLNDKAREDRARLIVGAVEVESSHMVWFDNFERELGPEHIIASGALPPDLTVFGSMASSIGMADFIPTRRFSMCLLSEFGTLTCT